MGLDRTLDFRIVPNYNQAPDIKAGGLKIDSNLLLKQGFSIHVFGTFDKIEKKVEPLPIKLLENTTNAVTDVLRGGINIFEGLN